MTTMTKAPSRAEQLRHSDRMVWLIAGLALIAIGTAVALALQISKEARDTGCARSAANRDREALVRLETAQREHLLRSSSPDLVVTAINNYLTTVRADDLTRTAC